MIGGVLLVVSLLVPKEGLEPPRTCAHMDLNHARLPIPPLGHLAVLKAGSVGGEAEPVN